MIKKLSICRMAGIVVIVALLSSLACGKKAQPQHKQYTWTFVYYLSYDNNLDIWTDHILQCLEDGVRDNGIAVAVLADRRRDNSGLQQILITRENGKTTRQLVTTASDNSAGSREMEAFFTWTAEQAPAENYAVFFLDHGGRLDQMCYDEAAAAEDAGGWLSAHQTGAFLRTLNNTLGKRIRLLMLQQCGRGMIENYYAFRGAADYLLSSSEMIGAPNTYYLNMLTRTAQQPALSGAQLAEIIAAEDVHYKVYTLVKAAALDDYAQHLQAVADAVSASGFTKIKRLPVVFTAGDEAYCSMEEVLNAIKTDATAEVIDRFIAWCRIELTVRNFKPDNKTADQLQISMLMPNSSKQLAGYADLPYFQDTAAAQLLKTILGY